MPKTIETTVYPFHELNDKAKDKARDWWREVGVTDWYDTVYEDASQVGIKITGFDIGRGESIDLTIDDAKETARLILENHGEHCDTYMAAAEYNKSLIWLPEDEDDREDAVADAKGVFCQALQGCYLKSLREQYEYEMSDEAADENIEANEYTFTADGKRFG